MLKSEGKINGLIISLLVLLLFCNIDLRQLWFYPEAESFVHNSRTNQLHQRIDSYLDKIDNLLFFRYQPVS